MKGLKDIIAKQKAQLAAVPKKCSGKYFRHGDLEAEIRKQKEREEAEAAEKKRKFELETLVDLQERITGKRLRPSDSKKDKQHTASELSPSPLTGEEEQEPPVSKAEIFRRLRKLKQPVTLFGETPWNRYCRLCSLELQALDDEMTEGQHNVFHALQREEDDEEFDDVSKSKSESSNLTNAVEDTERVDAKKAQTDQSKEGVVIEWTQRMLSLWEEELGERSEEEKATADGRQQTAIHRQTVKDLKPLLRKLKHKELDSGICDRLYEIVQLCEERKYRDAHGAFMLLAIGNAAWPMGVTMVGIHERASRSKVYTSQVAHILNDETTRKYIQMFKRLMSFCQRKFKANPSQTILLSVHHV